MLDVAVGTVESHLAAAGRNMRRAMTEELKTRGEFVLEGRVGSAGAASADAGAGEAA